MSASDGWSAEDFFRTFDLKEPKKLLILCSVRVSAQQCKSENSSNSRTEHKRTAAFCLHHDLSLRWHAQPASPLRPDKITAQVNTNMQNKALPETQSELLQHRGEPPELEPTDKLDTLMAKRRLEDWEQYALVFCPYCIGAKRPSFDVQVRSIQANR